MQALEQVILPRSRDIGGFEVSRILPVKSKRMVGPFVFLDQMGPTEFLPGQGIDVLPHPHIGLATLTYLYQGSLMHADSLGVTQRIVPGEINWMTAGRGITHSERTHPEDRARGMTLEGFQSWVALPKALEECEPDFEHHPNSALPEIIEPGVHMTLLLGEAYGCLAPAQTYSPLFYIDAQIDAGFRMTLPNPKQDRALYIRRGVVECDGSLFESGQLLVIKPDSEVSLLAQSDTHLLLLGGEPLDEPRHMFWNFVSSDKALIEQAKADWAAENWGQGRFELPPNDRAAFVPLP